MKNLSSILIITLLVSLLMACNSTTRKQGKPLVINKAVSIPNDTIITLYAPDSYKKMEFWASNAMHKPGKAFSDAANEAFGRYFSQVSWFDRSSTAKPNLYVDLDPDWDYEGAKVFMTVDYKVFNGAGEEMTKGTYKKSASFNYYETDAGYYNAAFQAMQSIAVRILNTFTPSAEKFPNALAMNEFDVQKLINLEKPVSSGTGFFVNESGFVVTANHVIDDCFVTKVQTDTALIDASVAQSSSLLDIALIDTGYTTNSFIKFRPDDTLTLGEKIITVSYPLKGLLESSPNMTFGNVTSKKALNGSLGLFQFSAPIQPGSSGGAIVSEDSELLGVVTSTLNISDLVEKGVIPQNVNFALEAKYLKKFLNKHEVTFVEQGAEVPANSSETALKNAVQIACFQ